MSVTIKSLDVVEVKYPITRDELKAGQLAENEGGTIVIVSKSEFGLFNPVNINNGLGGYNVYSKFRVLANHEITITTNSEGIGSYQY
jgi:hypothetical protein